MACWETYSEPNIKHNVIKMKTILTHYRFCRTQTFNYLANTLSLMHFSFPYCTDCTSVRPLHRNTTKTFIGLCLNKVKYVEHLVVHLISTAKFAFTFLTSQKIRLVILMFSQESIYCSAKIKAILVSLV